MLAGLLIIGPLYAETHEQIYAAMADFLAYARSRNLMSVTNQENGIWTVYLRRNDRNEIEWHASNPELAKAVAAVERAYELTKGKSK
jgi:hypothetical protein